MTTERGAAGGLGAPDDGRGEAEVGLDVELEPQREAVGRPVARGRNDLLDRHGGRHAAIMTVPAAAQARAVARSPSGCARRWKAVGATSTGIASRAAEQRDPELGSAAAAQHARDQADARERRLVGAQRDLVVRPAGEEVVHGRGRGVRAPPPRSARSESERMHRSLAVHGGLPRRVASSRSKNARSGSRCTAPVHSFSRFSVTWCSATSVAAPVVPDDRVQVAALAGAIGVALPDAADARRRTGRRWSWSGPYSSVTVK